MSVCHICSAPPVLENLCIQVASSQCCPHNSPNSTDPCDPVTCCLEVVWTQSSGLYLEFWSRVGWGFSEWAAVPTQLSCPVLGIGGGCVMGCDDKASWMKGVDGEQRSSMKEFIQQ